MASRILCRGAVNFLLPSRSLRSSDAVEKYSEVTITGTLDTSAPAISSVTLTPKPADTSAAMLITVKAVGWWTGYYLYR